MNTYKAIAIDINKFKARISRRQSWCKKAATERDCEMVRMYKKDIRDLRTILNFICKNDFKRAWTKLYWLDTSVRDDVPPRLYNFLAKENGYM